MKISKGLLPRIYLTSEYGINVLAVWNFLQNSHVPHKIRFNLQFTEEFQQTIRNGNIFHAWMCIEAKEITSYHRMHQIEKELTLVSLCESIHIIMPHQASRGDDLIVKHLMWWHDLKSNYGHHRIYSDPQISFQANHANRPQLYYTYQFQFWIANLSGTTSMHLATLNMYASLLFLSTFFLSSALKKRVKFNKTELNFISSNLVHMVRPLWHINKLTIFQVSLIIISHVCMCSVASVRLKCWRCSQHSL